MPGMKLGFIHNATQRVASRKNVPASHLEAVVKYGAPAKRAAAVKKIIQGAASLVQHKETYQLILTVCQETDSTKRCELLFALRRKLKDMCRNRFGNIVLQRLFESVPSTQVREIAEDLRGECTEIARDPFGNRVLQTLAKREEPRDIIATRLAQDAVALAQHATAQHVIAAFVDQGAEEIIDLVSDPGVVGSLIAMPESAVLTSLVGSVRVTDDIQIRTRALLLEALTGIVVEGRQHFALVAAITASSAEEVSQWQKKLDNDTLTKMAQVKGMCEVAAALIRRMSGKPREQAVVSAIKGFDSVEAAACHSYGSVVLREALSPGSVALPGKMLQQLVQATDKLATDAAGVVVVQRLIVLQTSQTEGVVTKIAARAEELMKHPCGTHALQAAMDHAQSVEHRQSMAKAVLEHVGSAATDQHGTYALQKAFAVADAPVVESACAALAEAEVERLAFDCKANFVVAAALTTAKRHGLTAALKTLMDKLKPHVTNLATSPWVGNIVLTAMLTVGSAALQEAIRNVIYLKCEMFLSEVPERKEKRDDAQRGEKRPNKRHTTESRE